MTFVTFGELYGATLAVCKCNLCKARFEEKEILVEVETEEEYCPKCFEKGYIQSDGEVQHGASV